jgi:hypothetical protein
MAGWYRRQVGYAATDLVGTWESILGVRVQRLFVQRMKTPRDLLNGLPLAHEEWGY